MAILNMMRPDYALAQQVRFTDPDIVADLVSDPLPEGHGQVRAYMLRPAGRGPWPAVVVVHENRGLNPYIEDVARRVAKDGFLALAPDGLSSVGGYPGNDDRGRVLQATVDATKRMNGFLAAVERLFTHEALTGRVGITGFCYGGRVAAAAAVAFEGLRAAVPVYGRQPRPEDAARIKAALMFHDADPDTRISAGWPAFDEARKAAGVAYEAHVIQAPTTGSTTMRPRAMTRRRQGWPGIARPRMSGRIRHNGQWRRRSNGAAAPLVRGGSATHLRQLRGCTCRVGSAA